MNSFIIEKLAIDLKKELKKPELNEVKKVFLAEKIRILEEYLNMDGNQSALNHGRIKAIKSAK